MYLYLFRNMYKKTLAVSALPFHTCVVFPYMHSVSMQTHLQTVERFPSLFMEESQVTLEFFPLQR